MSNKYLHLLILTFLCQSLFSQRNVEFSTAGFYAMDESPRTVESLNPYWHFCKDPDGVLADSAWRYDYDCSSWEIVSLPHGIEYLPEEASGGKNYQGQVWYKKHFNIIPEQRNKRLLVHFEAIMGKSRLWVNGIEVTRHYGGFLPLIADISEYVKPDCVNDITIWADNSDDPYYPPGKPQANLDFAYFGGIYRDVWLITTGHTYITDPNQEDIVGGGGLLVYYTDVSDDKATVNTKLHVRNDGDMIKGKIEYHLRDALGKTAGRHKHRFSLRRGEERCFQGEINVKKPMLWSLDAPNLYWIEVMIYDDNGDVIDGYKQRIGIRTMSFSPEEGFVLNGKPLDRKLIGVNRHQDFAVIGNALSNSLHWRDAYKFKEAGIDIIRNAHYPQDPAFMDACDELGMLVIVNTPGWQFWNDSSIFQERVYGNIRDMVRRDRNHPCTAIWEPVLNETYFTKQFAFNAHHIVKEEFPHEPNYTASDLHGIGSEYFDIVFSHPRNGDKEHRLRDESLNKVLFTREWGDNVDDWYSHNSPSRVSRRWGEQAMLVQARHYARPSYEYTCYDALCRTDISHIGGALWHVTDHQRGYHPDPFYGGILDAFRRPKYSYHMFRAQSRRNAPMVYIAHEMTPFSSADVTVYSNCDEVRLITSHGDTIQHIRPHSDGMTEGMPSPPIVFYNAFDFMTDKDYARSGQHHKSFLKAEGYIDGIVVTTDIRMPSRRPAKLDIIFDTDSLCPIANGSDLFVAIAQITDANGIVKRLNNEVVYFEIEGPGRLVGDATIGANPKAIEWGEAPVLIQTTTTPGVITLRASVLLPGDTTPIAAEAQITTRPSTIRLNYDESLQLSNDNTAIMRKRELTDKERAVIESGMREVELQQEAFGEKKP